MSDESFRFTPGPQPEFPRLVMRAFISPDQFVEWIFTPPPTGTKFCYHFHAMQSEEGVLHVDMFPDTMQPIE